MPPKETEPQWLTRPSNGATCKCLRRHIRWVLTLLCTYRATILATMAADLSANLKAAVPISGSDPPITCQTPARDGLFAEGGLRQNSFSGRHRSRTAWILSARRGASSWPVQTRAAARAAKPLLTTKHRTYASRQPMAYRAPGFALVAVIVFQIHCGYDTRRLKKRRQPVLCQPRLATCPFPSWKVTSWFVPTPLCTSCNPFGQNISTSTVFALPRP